ncbi:MAG: hypothetical protein ACK4L7_05105, partial [Flavobacteriales bacterium]
MPEHPARAVRQLAERAFAVGDARAFDALALELYRLHAGRNPVYRAFLAALPRRAEPASARDIPCLPITLFRSHRVLLDGLEPAVSFT